MTVIKTKLTTESVPTRLLDRPFLQHDWLLYEQSTASLHLCLPPWRHWSGSCDQCKSMGTPISDTR